MEHQDIKSSQLKSLAYDPETRTLEVRFKCSCQRGAAMPCARCGGAGHIGTYSYANVPPEHVEAIRAAESAGSTFHKLIKQGGYKFTFIPGGEKQ